MNRSTSNVWYHFKKMECGKVGQCLNCKAMLRLSGGSSTTNLLRHLKSKHPTVPVIRESSSSSTTQSSSVLLDEENSDISHKESRIISDNVTSHTSDMKWSNELILEFIHVYEKHPIIWDPDHPEHKNRKSHIDTWNSIGNQMSVDIPVEVLKKKKECLMATYRALKRKKTDNKPTWHAFEAMDRFLAKVRKDNSLYNLENINCMEQDDSANFEFDDVENESSKVSYHHMVEEIAEEIDMDDNKLVERIVLPIIDNNNVIRKKFISNGIIDDELRGYIRQTSASLREIQQKLNDQECNRNNCRAASSVTTTTNAESSGESSSSVSLTSSPSAATAENECNLYGQLLVTRLKAMPAKSRKILMHKIDQLVFDAEINEIN